MGALTFTAKEISVHTEGDYNVQVTLTCKQTRHPLKSTGTGIKPSTVGDIDIHSESALTGRHNGNLLVAETDTASR